MERRSWKGRVDARRRRVENKKRRWKEMDDRRYEWDR